MPVRATWRFLLAGLLACCGLVLLFIASFGDPTARLRDLHPAFAATRAPERQAAPASTIEPPAVPQVDQGSMVAAVAAPPGCSAPQAEANAGMAPAPQSEPAQRTASAGRQDGSASLHQQSHKRRRSAHHQSTASRSATRQASKATPRASDRPLSRRDEDRHSPTDGAVSAKDVETRAISAR
jgi:hypothetical protein